MAIYSGFFSFTFFLVKLWNFFTEINLSWLWLLGIVLGTVSPCNLAHTGLRVKKQSFQSLSNLIDTGWWSVYSRSSSHLDEINVAVLSTIYEFLIEYDLNIIIYIYIYLVEDLTIRQRSRIVPGGDIVQRQRSRIVPGGDIGSKTTIPNCPWGRYWFKDNECELCNCFK